MVGKCLDWSTVSLACGLDFVHHIAFRGLCFLIGEMKALEWIVSKISASNGVLASFREGGDTPKGTYTPFEFEGISDILCLNEWTPCSFIMNLLPSSH